MHDLAAVLCLGRRHGRQSMKIYGDLGALIYNNHASVRASFYSPSFFVAFLLVRTNSNLNHHYVIPSHYLFLSLNRMEQLAALHRSSTPKAAESLSELTFLRSRSTYTHLSSIGAHSCKQSFNGYSTDMAQILKDAVIYRMCRMKHVMSRQW